MMGMQTIPAQLFYDFCLDDHIPDDHLLRRIDQFLDLAGVRTELLPFYSTIGRPSIDPELMRRMLIVGYCMGIRSERRLCEQVHLNWPIAGSAVWGLTARCLITPRSRAIGMAGSGRAISCGICSRRSLSGACRKAWSAVKGSLWMQASSRQMPTSSALFPAISGGPVASMPMLGGPFASIWQRWTMRHN